MNKNGLVKIVRDVQSAMKKHSPEILMGVGIAGMVTTTVMAVRATPKALQRIEQAGYDKGSDEAPCMDMEYTPLTTLEMVKVAWPCYIPAAIVGMASIGCLICSNSVNARRNAALATAYTLTESTLKEYQEKVIEEIGEKRESGIRDAIAKDRLDKNPVANNTVVITDSGNTMCFDVLSGRYFRSDIDKIKKTVNELNRRMCSENYISLNEFYYELGLEGIKQGDEIGWCIDKGYIDLDFRSRLNDKGEPCLVIDYQIVPQYDYNR